MLISLVVAIEFFCQIIQLCDIAVKRSNKGVHLVYERPVDLDLTVIIIHQLVIAWYERVIGLYISISQLSHCLLLSLYLAGQ